MQPLVRAVEVHEPDALDVSVIVVRAANTV